MNKNFCPNCGAELSRDDIFCGSCGTRIDEFGVVKSEKPTGTKRRPAGVTIIAILTILGGILGPFSGIDMMAMSGKFQFAIAGFDLMARSGSYCISDEEAALFGIMAGILGMVFIITGFVALVIGYGLWTLKRWARMAAIIMVIIGIVGNIIAFIIGAYCTPNTFDPEIFICFFIICGISLWYLSKPAIKEVFEG